jgi:hypothetical protein
VTAMKRRSAIARLARAAWRPLERWRPFYWLRTHTVDKYHLIDIRNARNGYAWGWIDRSDAFLFANFAILVAFVEKEFPGCVDWDYDDDIKALAAEIKALYEWWTVGRKNEHDAANDADAPVDTEARDDEMLLRLMKAKRVMWT